MKAVVPLDGSELAQSVLPTARRLLDHVRDLEVHLVTVLDPGDVRGRADHISDEHPPLLIGAGKSGGEYPRLVESHGEAIERSQREASEWLARVADGQLPGIVAYPHTVWSRDPAEAIAELARDLDADVIVMATHGRSGISHLLAGSVTTSVIRSSGKPVLVIGPHE